MLKKGFLLLALALCFLFPVAAMADGQAYLIPDSDTRRLTEAELWDYQYDTLGYVLNEIFARHGYHFKQDGRYGEYFRSTGWYRENTQYATNEEIYKHELTNIEWANEGLVKKVRADMKTIGTTNPLGLTLEEALRGEEKPCEIAFDSSYGYFYGGQKLHVYNGPGWKYSRAGNGKACALTDEEIAVAGIVDGYVLVLYEAGKGFRSGYVDLDDLHYDFVARHLHLNSAPRVLSRSCQLMADPYNTLPLSDLPAGTRVTALAGCDGQAYIEVSANSELLRGFVPPDCLAD